MFPPSSSASRVASISACLLLAACGDPAPSPPPVSTVAFSVGGTVAGLDGSGLVLRNNGADDLSIAADGPFGFATALPDGGTYEVTVANQPASGARTCTVRRGRGTIAGAPVTQVAVVCTPNAPGNPQARMARPQSPVAGSCDGLLDYSDEFLVARVALVRNTDVGGGLAEVEVSVDLENQDVGRFRAASLSVEAGEASALGVLAGVLPAEFGPIEPGGLASSSATLELVLRAERVADLLDGLEDGAVPVAVHADEETVYPAGTMIRNWSRSWDDRFRAYAGNATVDPAAPYPPGATWDLVMPDLRLMPPPLPADARPTYEGGGGDGAGELAMDAAVCAGAAGLPANAACYSAERGDAPLFLTPGDEALYGLPRAVHRVRVLAITANPIIVGGTPYSAWLIRVQRTDGERLPDLVESGSFCAGEEQTVGAPVAKTRIHEVDQQEVHPADRDEAGQPIRFNLAPDWAEGLSVSGQLGCSRLQPEVSFRIRDGRVRSALGFSVGCSIAAELSARAAVKVEEFQEPLEMWGQCFALPPLNLGPASIPVTLQLRHYIDVRASAAAGAVAGFSKRWDAGVSFACEAGAGEEATCAPSWRLEPSPFEFTPPQVVEATNFTMQAGTTLKADLRFGFEYLPPFEWTCDLGAGITLETSAYGKVVVTPAAEPWWTTTYGAEVSGGVDFGLYGLGLVRVNAELFGVEEVLDSGGPLLGGLRGAARPGPATARPAAPPLAAGADQRWSVAIDDTAVPNGVDSTSIAALPDGSSVTIADEPVGGRSLVVKLDPTGAIEWTRRLAIGLHARRVRALPDGTVVVGASTGYLARLDGAGQVIWTADVAVGHPDATWPRCVMHDFAPLQRSPDVFDYVVVGEVAAVAPSGSEDGCAFRVNADGTVPWAWIYAAADLQHLNGAAATHDGGVAVVGEAGAQLAGNRRFPLAGKLDAETGRARWWRTMPMYRLARLNAVAEGADGALVAVGTSGRTIRQTGAGLLARLDADGGGVQHALLFQDLAWESLLDFEAWVPTTAGNSPYDELFDVAAAGDGFVIAGRSGLGAETSGWVARIDRQLGTRWFRVLDGAGLDGLSGVAPAADGIFVSGHSGSLPEPDGPNTGENQLWVTKLPFTGAVEFLPEAGVTTRFVATGLRHSSADPLVSPEPARELEAVETQAPVLSTTQNPAAVTAGTTYCAVLLTRSGRESTLAPCPGAP